MSKLQRVIQLKWGIHTRVKTDWFSFKYRPVGGNTQWYERKVTSSHIGPKLFCIVMGYYYI